MHRNSVLITHKDMGKVWCTPIFQQSDYIIGLVTPAIGPNKSKKLTQLIAPVHNIRGKV